MTSPSRTISQESGASSPIFQTDNGESSDQKTTDGTKTPSPHSPKESRPLGIKSRTPSHSLLSSSPSSSSLNRKGRFADAGTTGLNVGRASLSMPPPATKPSSIYRPSSTRYPSTTLAANEQGSNRASIDSAPSSKSGNESAIVDDTERAPPQSSLPEASSEPSPPLILREADLKPPSDTDGSSNRLSFSSLYSFGSAIYNGTTGPISAPQSLASSNAGSVKGPPMEHRNPHSAPLSPTKSSLKDEVSSTATTATYPISATANAQLQPTGQNTQQYIGSSLVTC